MKNEDKNIQFNQKLLTRPKIPHKTREITITNNFDFKNGLPQDLSICVTENVLSPLMILPITSRIPKKNIIC